MFEIDSNTGLMIVFQSRILLNNLVPALGFHLLISNIITELPKGLKELLENLPLTTND